MTTSAPDRIDAGESRGGPDAIEVTVLMPCLNEAETLGACIREALDALRDNNVVGEVLIADNGSTDGSQQIATDLGARVVPIPRRGYGAALQGGIEAARGRFVLMGDSDDSYDFSHLPRFLEKLRAGCDLVMGNRFKGGIAPGAMPTLHRLLGNPVLTAIGRMFFRSPAGDIYCGLRGFRREAVLRMDLRTTGMEFAIEMVIKSTLLHLRIAEVPTTLSPDGRGRPPHLRSWRDGWRSLRFMLVYSPRWLFLYPGLLLMVLGAALMLWLLPGPRTVSGVTFDVHTLLYASIAIAVGYQAVLFSVLSKVFALAEGLQPWDQRMERLFKRITLESGLLAGFVLLLAGLTASVASVLVWQEHSFGDLDVSRVLRLVIPASLCLLLGSQTILASFFLSLLGLARR